MKRASAAGLPAALALFPIPAAAHEVLPGVDGLAGEVLHALAAPELVLCIVATGVAAGRIGWRELPWSLGVLAGAMLAGKAAHILAPQITMFWRAPAIVTLAAGVALAAIPVLPRIAGLTLVAALGLVVAIGVPAEEPGPSGVVRALAAAMTTAALIAAAIAAPVWMVERRFGGVGPQVAGAWIAAIAAMNLALTYRIG